MSELQPFHPVWYLLARHISEENYTLGRQFTADDMQDVAAWCGGTIVADDGAGQTCLDVPANPDYEASGGRAYLGDYIMCYQAQTWFWVEPAEAFLMKWATEPQYAAWVANPEVPTRIDAPFTITFGS